MCEKSIVYLVKILGYKIIPKGLHFTTQIFYCVYTQKDTYLLTGHINDLYFYYTFLLRCAIILFNNLNWRIYLY